LNLQLITTDYFGYEAHPELYLLDIIREDNPWPNEPISKLQAFLQSIAKLYNPVSYHNLTHAFDVMTVSHSPPRASISISSNTAGCKNCKYPITSESSC
jgi:hypothetical protein